MWFLRFVVLFFFFLAAAPLSALSDFYWESPDQVSAAGASFPVSAFNGEISAVAWQERGTPAKADDTAGSLWVSIAVKKSGGGWEIRSRVGGPYPYSGTEPAILSIAVSPEPRGRIFVAAAASNAQTEILISDDAGKTFTARRVNLGSQGSVAPRIFARPDGGCYLFVARGRDQSLTIYFSRSDDGVTWAPFVPFVTDSSLQLNFLPTFASLEGTDYVVFQSFVGGADSTPSFQLYLTSSTDSGAAWSAPKRITTFKDPVSNTNADPSKFDNQRANMTAYGGKLYLVWERRYSTASPQIYGLTLDAAGNIEGRAERVNTDNAYCNNPVALIYENEPTVLWFDNRKGANRIFLGQKSGIEWTNYDLSGSSGESSFGRPAADSDGLHVFWQTGTGGKARIYDLEPDRTVTAPRLTALNFTPDRRSRAEKVRISWNTPYDTSGIVGFSWLWTLDENAEPPKRLMAYASENAPKSFTADTDGVWYCSVIAQDYAGNWSEPARIDYIRDTTPPPAANIIPPEEGEDGYLPSNTFTIGWNPPPASDVAGYTWNLQYIGGEDRAAVFTVGEEEVYPIPIPDNAPLPARILGVSPQAFYNNQDNGLWRFSVAAIDEVGNIGPESSVVFRTNKYVPRTFVTWADSQQDEQGILSMRLVGRGFAVGGDVTEIWLDRDGEPPYDREFRLENGDYKIDSDREISGLSADNMEAGRYRIGIVHPARGLYVSGLIVTLDETGTVKFGDYSRFWQPSWTRREAGRFVFNAGMLIIAVIFAFSGLGIAASARGIGNVVAETAACKVEAAALITGDFMPSEKKKHAVRLRRRGIGLRFKMAAFTIALVLLVVTLVSTPLYYMMTRTQQETLLKGLWDRSTVLLDGLASSAEAYLPSRDILNLGFLPAQSTAIPEARYVTITGYNAQTAVFDDLVWASNDPNLLSKIDTEEFKAGVSRLTDSLSPELQKIADELNNEARAQVGELTASITSLGQEGVELALKTDAESQQRLQDIQITRRTLETQLNAALTAIGKNIGSQPAFSTTEIPRGGSRDFIFYKPILYRQGSEDYYFRGLVRLDVTIDSIIDQINANQRRLLRIILIVALAAITLGAIGALILSSIIIRPIIRLVSHVERIRDTEDKAKLAGVDINIHSSDEIAILGATINDMTHGLVKAAAAAADLSIGKEIQKKFIPLELDREGNKLSSGYKDAKNAEFFGYYEGAKGVSGDYFDYQDLDGRYYAIIKCDVAGKGIPAALIMIQVATMFLNYFKQWKPTAKGMHIEEVVYQINDFIETLAFKGRFAAFTLCLFDSETGVVRFCNAGDNIVHLYDASEGKVKTLTLPETPATGVLPNFLVESKGGYTVQTMTIDHGDILFLYTDGIEEAKRKFRNAEFKEILCEEGGKDVPEGTIHETHTVGQGDEEMGPERVCAIINAVMNKQVYTLYKWHNGEGDIEYKFDFTDCTGSVEEVIMAMVSVEKMFRLYKQSGLTDDERVLVDKKVDEFLKKHFLLYRNYCSFTRDYPGGPSYLYYTRVKEDDQYDDLTILGIKRK